MAKRPKMRWDRAPSFKVPVDQTLFDGECLGDQVVQSVGSMRLKRDYIRRLLVSFICRISFSNGPNLVYSLLEFLVWRISVLRFQYVIVLETREWPF